MCGIAGVISAHRGARTIVSKMNRHQHHRGPNGDGIFHDKKIALGHVRLSIQDLSEAGAQPMFFEHLVLIYNGELYNFQILRAQLEVLGYNFHSRSDTEVVLKAWHCWGEQCLPKFDGMFAFAIFDKNSEKLFIVRDAYGVKPVFFSFLNSELVFGSELQAVADALDSQTILDEDAIATYLALQFIPAPATGLKGLNKLEAGHLLEVDISAEIPCAIRTVEWKKIFRPQSNPTQVKGVQDIDTALAEAIKKQMVSDVPVGAFLSGGVDSSLICHYAMKASPKPIHTFSIGFTDVGEEHDETLFAQKAAETIGSIHHPVQIELASISERIERTMTLTGELNADTSVFLTDIICEEACKHVTVCLSGAGGDELFAGYYRHQALIAIQYLNLMPQGLINFFRSCIQGMPQHRDSSIGNLLRRINYFLSQRTENGNFVSMLRNDSHFRQTSSFLEKNVINTIEDALRFDFQYFLGENILGFTDKVSMLHSLEVRVPFLDPNVIRVAEQIPIGSQVNLREKKIVLKKLAAQYFPDDIIYRKKQGFSAPIDVWLRKFSVAKLIELCSDGVAVRFVAEARIEELAIGFIEQRSDYSTQIYSLIVLNSWAKLMRL